MAMLGDIVELSVVVRDLDEAAARFTRLFGLSVHRRDTSERFGFKNAILPTGIGHIELLQPTDPGKAVGKFLAKRGEGVYLVGFECADVAGAGAKLRAGGVAGGSPRPDLAWGHPRQTHGAFLQPGAPERHSTGKGGTAAVGVRSRS